MRLYEPSPPTRYDFLRYVARKRGLTIGQAYKRGKQFITNEGIQDALTYHYGDSGFLSKSRPFFALKVKP